MTKKSYKFRLYPNKEQKEMFAKTFGCAHGFSFEVENGKYTQLYEYGKDVKRRLVNALLFGYTVEKLPPSKSKINKYKL